MFFNAYLGFLVQQLKLYLSSKVWQTLLEDQGKISKDFAQKNSREHIGKRHLG